MNAFIKLELIRRLKKISVVIFIALTANWGCTPSLHSTSMMAENVSAHPLPIEQWTNPNGVRVYFVNAPSLPMLDVRVVFNAGSARDGAKPSTAMLTAAMLDEGTGTLSADAIAEQFEKIGVQFGALAARDMALVELRTLSDEKTLSASVGLMAKILQSPAFPEKSLARIKNQVLLSLKRQQQLPGAIASKSFFGTIYAHHPYGSPVDGNENSIASISRSDLLNFYRQFYVGNNAVVAIVGDIDRATAEKISLQITAALPAGNEAPTLPTPLAISTTVNKHIEFDSTQTHILMGAPIITRDDPDYVALTVADHIFGGGGFGSILMEEIREKRGLAYSAGSSLTAMSAEGPLIISLQTRNDQANEALSITKMILQKFIKEGPTDDQLHKAKLEISGQYPLSIADNASITAHIASLGFYRLPITYTADYLEKVNKLTTADIAAALARHINIDHLAIITVGKNGEPKK